MKLFKIIIGISFSLNIFSQEVITPLGTHEQMYEYNRNNNHIGFEKNKTYYTKDINGILDPYIGYWRAINEGKEYIIYIYKYIDSFNISDNIISKTDNLHMKLQVTEIENGNVIYNDFSNSSEKKIIDGFDYVDNFFKPTYNNAYLLTSFRLDNDYFKEYYFYLFFSENNNFNKLSLYLSINKIFSDINVVGEKQTPFTDFIPLESFDFIFNKIENPFD